MWNFVLIGILVFACLIIIFVFWKSRKRRLSDSDKKYYQQKWQEILAEKDLRHALLTADKLLEKLLRHKGYQGTLGEMLKQSKKEYQDLNGLWFAHKLRNRLAHEIDFKLSDRDANSGLKYFEKALHDLGVF